MDGMGGGFGGGPGGGFDWNGNGSRDSFDGYMDYKLNGWIKEELYLDFGLEKATNVKEVLDQYVTYYNNERPAAALKYKSPVQYKIEQGFG